MVTAPHIRVGTRLTGYRSIYTLGGNESFRLDTASWTQLIANDADVCLPILRVQDPNGEIIAECSPPAVFAHFPTNPIGLNFTGPAAFADDFSLTPPDVYSGYALHDFGAVPVTSNMLTAWNQPPGNSLAYSATWLRSAGAVTYGGGVGFGASSESSSVTVNMLGAAAAGTYVMLVFNIYSASGFVKEGPDTAITVTDSVGGNIVDTSGHPDIGFSRTQRQLANGLFTESFAVFYRIVNPLGIGATITATFLDTTIGRIDVTAHVVTGLTVGNPIGPNPGGNYIGGSTSAALTPLTFSGLPIAGTPKWLGGVLVMGTYTTPSLGALDVMLERGDVATIGGGSTPPLSPHGYVQTTLPELHLGPGCTLTAEAVDSLGGARVADAVSDFLVWAVDEG